jgi:hypothetical protein
MSGLTLPVRGMLLLCASMAWAQAPLPSALDPGQNYERAIVVSPLVGRGTYSDPKRPALVPQRLAAGAAERSAAKGTDVILAYSWVPSDDGKMAIVEIVVRDPAAMAEFRKAAGQTPEALVFERGKASAALVDAEMRKLKKDFDRRSLRAVAP